MSLILKIPGIETLDNGLPAFLRLNERGAILGRSPTVTWCLPDPSSQISSRHCEISFRDGRYTLTDTSTNGTLVNGQILSAPHALRTGDTVTIGHYQIVAEVEGQATGPEPGAAGTPAQSAWDAWGAAPEPAAPQWTSPTPPPPTVQPAAAWPAATAETAWAQPASPEPTTPWDSPAPPDSWAPAAAASPWDTPAPPPPPPASAWSSPVPDVPQAASTDDIWGKLAEGYVVDWARGGFGQPAPAAADPLRVAPPAPPAFTDQPLAPPMAERTAPPSAQRPAPASPAAPSPSGDMLDGFFRQLGVPEDKLTSSDEAVLTTAGLLLRRLVAGMVVMLEARARAKSQMGAQGTALQFDGNNPMKFARTPEQALLQLLNPPERGFMSAERAVEDAFVDLQSHQMATLKAMQGALKATLDRFSPDSIRQRAETGGIMAKIFKDSREAALWKAYEKEFSGVVQGSDEAFMDVFSREFRKAYEDLTARKGG